MSIFKESFKPNIKKQLEKRQQAMLARTPQDIVYINGRNSWVRMSSSVNVLKSSITNPTMADLKNEGNYDNSLAKKYILQGGCINENGTLKTGVGMDFNNAYSRQSAEGIDYRLGIRPMPGITNIEVKSRGAYGSLRNVTVNFQCWDIHQLEDLELLYMRPGYTVLVEWGWAPYFDENNNLKSTVEFYDIVNQVKPKTDIWKELDEKMAKNGNYEAMFGYVKNYSWNARPDGGYDCTTDIISLGEVIESLKINYSPTTVIETIKENGLLAPNLEKLSSLDLDSAINIAFNLVPIIAISNFIIGLFGDSDKEKLEKAYTQSILTGLFYEMYTAAQKADPGTEDEGAEILFKDKKYGNEYVLFHKTINMNGEEKEDDTTIGEDDEQYYISLESLVHLLNNYVLLRDGKNKDQYALLSVYDDASFTTANRKTGDGYLLALAHPLEISIDPRVCLIKNNLWVDGININLASGGTDPKTGENIITFRHTFQPGEVETFVKNLIRNTVTVSYNDDDFSEKEIIQYIKDNIKGNKENVKEATRVFNELYSTYKVEPPNKVSEWGLDYNKPGNVGKTLKEISSGTNTFYDLLEDDIGADLSDKQIEDALGGEDNADEISDGDPIEQEKEKLEEKKKELDELAEEGKEGIEFLKNLPLPYYVNDDYRSELGIIGNIFINLRMLYEMSLDGNLEAQDKKEKNEIALYDFIKSIMSKVQAAIGNVNNFDLFVEKNVAKIIDINYVDKRDPKNVYDEAFQLEMHNLKSTVRSYKLESKIFQEQASIVAIGAQVGGGALGTDTTSLVAFNKSIIDRIIPVKDAPIDDLASSEAQAKAEAIINSLTVLYKFFGRLNSNWIADADFDVEKAGGYENALKDLINYMRTLTNSKTSNRAILPTTLSVDMDGIGGLIIGNIFKVPIDILPKGYKGSGNGGIGSNLGYIITGLGHTLGGGDWVTKIDAQTIILDNPPSELTDFNYSNITINLNPSTEKEVVTPTPDKINSDKPSTPLPPKRPSSNTKCKEKYDVINQSVAPGVNIPARSSWENIKKTFSIIPGGVNVLSIGTPFDSGNDFNYKMKNARVSKRTNPANYIVLHYTVSEYDDPTTHYRRTWESIKASSDFTIGRTGKIAGFKSYKTYKSWHYHKASWPGGAGFNNESIGFEIESTGYAYYCKTNNKFYTNGHRELNINEVTLTKTYRGHNLWHYHTDIQISAIANLIIALYNGGAINDKTTFLSNCAGNSRYNTLFPDKALTKKPPPGIITHGTGRNGKVDTFPQQNLLDMLDNLPTLIKNNPKTYINWVK